LLYISGLYSAVILLRLLLLDHSVDLVLQPLVLLKHLIIAFYLLLVGINILNNIDAAAVKLGNMNIGLAAPSIAQHVLLGRCLLMVHFLLRAVHLFSRLNYNL